MPTSTASRYHHGDLPRALREATADLINEKGVSGFSLREVARRAGVSHAAPAHHFGSVSGLLTSLAVEGFTELRDRLGAAAASTDDPVESFVAVGKEYLRVGLERPAHLAVMFRADCVEPDDEQIMILGAESFGVLIGVVERLRDEVNPDLDVEQVALLAWSNVQGLLSLSGLMGEMDKLSVESSADAVIAQGDGMCRLLLSGLLPR